MLDMNLVKDYLKDPGFPYGNKKNFTVLEDMKSPAVINCGIPLVARSRAIQDGWDEVRLAEYIKQAYDYFAFYQLLQVDAVDTTSGLMVEGLKIRYCGFTQAELEAKQTGNLDNTVKQ